jgi:hypothetical protein
MPLLHSTAATCYPNRTIIRNYPQRGRQAVLADPDGAVFAVLAVEGGDPPDYLATPGEWMWSSLHVRDPKQETAFYKVTRAHLRSISRRCVDMATNNRRSWIHEGRKSVD